MSRRLQGEGTRSITRARAGKLWVAACIGFVAALPACPKAVDEARPDVLLITIDTLRADHLSIYGSPRVPTPNMDRLGEEGAVFDAAYCDVTWTTPSVASTLTGTFPFRHKIRFNSSRLGPKSTTIAEILKGRGYATAAVIASYPVDSIFGFDRGFDRYDDDITAPTSQAARDESEDRINPTGDTAQDQRWMNLHNLESSRRPDFKVTSLAVSALESLKAGPDPFFLWVHYFGPHRDRDDGQSYFQQLIDYVNSYPDKVGRTDAEVGALLAAVSRLGLAENTLVILHSDHGETLGERKSAGHGLHLYEDNLKVPLLIRWPGRIPAGKRFSQLVGNVDIAATIAEAAGAKMAAGGMDGRSIFPVISEARAIRSSLYIETYLPTHRRFATNVARADGTNVKVGVRRYGVLMPPWKYIVSEHQPFDDTTSEPISTELAKEVSRVELYNLRVDGRERNSRIGNTRARQVREKVTGILDSYLEAEQADDDAGRFTPSASHIEKLRSLGYVE